MKKKYMKPQMNTYNIPRFSILAGSDPTMNMYDEEINENRIL
ncbi:MAG: hypothetical protein ACI3ZD_09675 [Prevotella sp.]